MLLTGESRLLSMRVLQNFVRQTRGRWEADEWRRLIERVRRIGFDRIEEERIGRLVEGNLERWLAGDDSVGPPAPAPPRLPYVPEVAPAAASVDRAPPGALSTAGQGPGALAAAGQGPGALAAAGQSPAHPVPAPGSPAVGLTGAGLETGEPSGADAGAPPARTDFGLRTSASSFEPRAQLGGEGGPAKPGIPPWEPSLAEVAREEEAWAPEEPPPPRSERGQLTAPPLRGGGAGGPETPEPVRPAAAIPGRPAGKTGKAKRAVRARKAGKAKKRGKAKTTKTTKTTKTKRPSRPKRPKRKAAKKVRKKVKKKVKKKVRKKQVKKKRK